jgi:mannan endo-1,4-beta-mannosidase
LILPFVNYWDDYGGREMYVHWSAENGGGAINPDDFYTNWKCRQYYKNAVKTILNRKNSYSGRIYKDDPAIFG